MPTAILGRIVPSRFLQSCATQCCMPVCSRNKKKNFPSWVQRNFCYLMRAGKGLLTLAAEMGL